MKWVMPPPVEENDVMRLALELSISPVIGEILLRRGITSPRTAEVFFDPRAQDLHSPFLLTDMDIAVSRIREALIRGEKILVHGDFDADGITGTALLVKALRGMGGDVLYYIPHRLEEGYGLSRKGIDYAVSNGCSLVVSVDCGVSSFEEVEYANSLGIDVIVTDHHESPPQLPPALAVVNPKRDTAYPFRDLAGCGVAFKLLSALTNSEKWIYWLLDLVAVGTVADVVPLCGENRALVKFGLYVLSKTKNVGLRALMDVARFNKELPSARDLAFIIAPRINAMGRLESADRVVELLITEDVVYAKKIAQLLEDNNLFRQQLDRRIQQEVEDVLPDELPPAIIMEKEGWHEGVVGIVASRLAYQLFRPVVLVALNGDKGKGSGRGIQGVDLYAVMNVCRDLLLSFGGHHQACGFSIERDRIPEFKKRFLSVLQELYPVLPMEETLDIDAVVSPHKLEDRLLDELFLLSPFGFGNPEPVFASLNVEVASVPQIIKGKHIKFRLLCDGTSLDVVGFRLAKALSGKITVGDRVDIAYKIRRDTYAGGFYLSLVDLHRRTDVGEG